MKEIYYWVKLSRTDNTIGYCVRVIHSQKGFEIEVVEYEQHEPIWGFTSNRPAQTLGQARRQLAAHEAYKGYKHGIKKIRMQQMMRVI